MSKLQFVLKAGKTDTETAMQLFDELETVDIQFLTGSWRGAGFHTDHYLDGLLEAAGWYGKAFIDPDKVHPLLFYKAGRRGVFPLNPAFLPLRILKLPLLKNKLLRVLILLTKPLFSTRKFKARVKMVQFRDKLSAAMIYDDQPVTDVFRKVDENTLLGMMDMKGMKKPFFFVLRREANADLKFR